MHTVRNLILTLSLLCFSQSLFPQTKADSLNHELRKSKGERKLELMFELANQHIDTPAMMEVAKQVEQEALKQKNMRYLAGSYTLKSRYFINVSSNLDSTIYYAELSIRTYDEYDIKNPGDSYQLAGSAYLRQGYYELAIYNAKEFLKCSKSTYGSYALLAEAYMAMSRYDLAKDILLQAIDYFNQAERPNLAHNELSLYRLLVTSYTQLTRYEKALETCATMENILEQKKEQLQDPLVIYFTYTIYNLYASIYIAMDDAIKAKEYLDKAKKIPENIYSGHIENMINITLSEYYLLAKDYEKALSFIELAISYLGNHKSLDTASLVELKIKALQLLKRSDEALVLQQELMHYKDSVYQINIPLQLSQLSKNYELDKVKLEREKDKANLEKSRAINIGFIIVFGLFAVILVIVRRNTKKLKDKNKALYKQYQEVDKFLNSTVSKSNESESLFDRIEASMKVQQVYRQPNLTREDLAKILNTNRGYLTDAIKAETGKTFLEYVNQYRLNYARFQLMKDRSTPVIDIMYDCGFSSKSPFYRLFKEEFGMSPNELREVKANLEEEI